MNTRMMTRIAMAVAAWVLLITSVAQAGGWAVVTLDDLPKSIMAGQAINIGFTVRQHGRTLRDDLTPAIHFDRADGKDSFAVTAKREGGSGHYAAAITFPREGTWNWIVDTEQFGMISQELPPLTVMAAAPITNSTASLPFAIGLAGSIGAIGALLIWLRLHTRLALAAMAIAALMGVFGLATASRSMAQSAAQPDQVALGQELFVAKGCVMCHTHAAFNGEQTYWIGAQPPDLTTVKLSADYLRQWLKDPSALKPGTVMPTLDLKPDEIEALIAFLKANSQ
jgi:cytochrome c2